MLLSLVLMTLHKSAEILRASNKTLFDHLFRTSNMIKGANTLYMDILQADKNISIVTKKEFHRLTISDTRHSLYGLSKAKVTWLVHKEKNTLLRIEGGEYQLPLRREESVAIDEIATNMELFRGYRSKKEKELLVMIKVVGQKPQTFMVQNLAILPKPKKFNMNRKNPKRAKDKNSSKMIN